MYSIGVWSAGRVRFYPETSHQFDATAAPPSAKIAKRGRAQQFLITARCFCTRCIFDLQFGGVGRNGGPSRDQVFGREEWPMRYMEGYSGGTPEEPRRSNPHVHHQHQHAQPNAPQQVSLETHQTDRGANTTIAATTHHLHEMEVSFVTLDT